MMNANSHPEAEYVLRRALALVDDDLAARHRWLWETERWHELVVALLSRVTVRSEMDVRAATESLGDAGLLDVEALSASCQSGTTLEPDTPLARRIREVLEDSGFKPDEAQKGATVLCEVAHGFSAHFQGQVQCYLRHYGELMLSESRRFFQFSALDEASVRFALTYWLQNVLNMPLSLVDDDMRALCQEHGIQPSDIMAAADTFGVNLALVDDVISRYVATRKAAQQPEGPAHPEEPAA